MKGARVATPSQLAFAKQASPEQTGAAAGQGTTRSQTPVDVQVCKPPVVQRRSLGVQAAPLAPPDVAGAPPLLAPPLLVAPACPDLPPAAVPALPPLLLPPLPARPPLAARPPEPACPPAETTELVPPVVASLASPPAPPAPPASEFAGSPDSPACSPMGAPVPSLPPLAVLRKPPSAVGPIRSPVLAPPLEAAMKPSLPPGVIAAAPASPASSLPPVALFGWLALPPVSPEPPALSFRFESMPESELEEEQANTCTVKRGTSQSARRALPTRLGRSTAVSLFLPRLDMLIEQCNKRAQECDSHRESPTLRTIGSEHGVNAHCLTWLAPSCLASAVRFNGQRQSAAPRRSYLTILRPSCPNRMLFQYRTTLIVSEN